MKVLCLLSGVMVLVVCVSPVFAKKADTNTKDSKTSPIRVAIFTDPESTGKSGDAVIRIIKKRTDMTITKVTTATVRQPDFFSKYDVFILPGGSGGGEAKAVGEKAGKEIARQVEAGKGLIGICAGGYYVSKGWNADTSALDVVAAENNDGEHWARGQQFIAVKVVGGDDAKSSRTMWYENGPIFKKLPIAGLKDYTPLVKYETDLAAKGAPKGQMGGYDAIIAAPYGQGRVVAFGPHPEKSPQVNHWLINAIKWSAGRHGSADAISADSVLEGK